MSRNIRNCALRLLLVTSRFGQIEFYIISVQLCEFYTISVQCEVCTLCFRPVSKFNANYVLMVLE